MDSTSLQTYAMSPISRLPAEILLEIFDLVIEDCDLIMEWYQEITHVCRHWRQLAISTARLWTNIPVDSDCNNPPYWTHTALERSKPAMLDISLYHSHWQTNIAIFKHIARIRAIDITNDLEELDKISFILSVVGDDAKFKELTWLTIHNESRNKRRLFKLPDSFSTATKLEHLDLRYTEIDWKSLLLMTQNLTWLTLHSTLLPGNSWEELLGALAQMPRLSMLDLTHTLPSVPLQSNIPIVHLTQLKHLIIIFDEPSQMWTFLLRVAFPPLSLLNVGCDETPRSEDFYARVIQGVIQKVPTSFANDFLRLTIDGTLRKLNLSCYSHHSNNLGAQSEHTVRFTFAFYSPGLCKGIVRDTIALLRLNSTTQSLDFRMPIAKTPQEFVDLFGPITKLTAIRVGGGSGHYITLALTRPIYHSSTPTPSFPFLETIELVRVDYQDMRSVELLEDALIHRFEHGVEIKALNFIQCPGLDSVIIERFAYIVVDVSWTEI